MQSFAAIFRLLIIPPYSIIITLSLSTQHLLSAVNLLGLYVLGFKVLVPVVIINGLRAAATGLHAWNVYITLAIAGLSDIFNKVAVV